MSRNRRNATYYNDREAQEYRNYIERNRYGSEPLFEEMPYEEELPLEAIYNNAEYDLRPQSKSKSKSESFFSGDPTVNDLVNGVGAGVAVYNALKPYEDYDSKWIPGYYWNLDNPDYTMWKGGREGTPRFVRSSLPVDNDFLNRLAVSKNNPFGLPDRISRIPDPLSVDMDKLYDPNGPIQSYHPTRYIELHGPTGSKGPSSHSSSVRSGVGSEYRYWKDQLGNFHRDHSFVLPPGMEIDYPDSDARSDVWNSRGITVDDAQSLELSHIMSQSRPGNPQRSPQFFSHLTQREPALTHGNKGSFIFSNTENVSDILIQTTNQLSITNGSLYKFPCNPGLYNVFPVASQYAIGFQYYKFRKLIFHYFPTSGSAIISDEDSGAMGKIVMAGKFNVTDPDFSSLMEMENYGQVASCVSWKKASFEIDCSNSLDRYFVRIDPNTYQSSYNWQYASAAQGQLTDFYNFYLAAVNAQSEYTVGQIFVEYEIEFSCAQIQASVIGSGILYWRALLGPPGAIPTNAGGYLNPLPIVSSHGNLDMSISSLTQYGFVTVAFPQCLSQGIYRVEYILNVNGVLNAASGSQGSGVIVSLNGCNPIRPMSLEFVYPNTPTQVLQTQMVYIQAWADGVNYFTGTSTNPQNPYVFVAYLQLFTSNASFTMNIGSMYVAQNPDAPIVNMYGGCMSISQCHPDFFNTWSTRFYSPLGY